MNNLWTERKYPCGCVAHGEGDIPAYCAEHDKPPKSPVNRLIRFAENIQAESYQVLWEVTKDAPSAKTELPPIKERRATEVQKILGFNDARDALENMLSLVEDNWLIRNVWRDSEPDFWIRQEEFILRLAKARNALIRMKEVQ